MAWTKCKARTSVFINGTIFFLVLVITITLRTGRFRLTKKPGFYCNDWSISFPVLDEMFTAGQIITVCLLLSIFVILVVQLATSTSRCTLANYFRCSAISYIDFLYGFACILISVKLAKNVTGELRPNFLDVCKPDYSKINCSEGYITEYTCTSHVPLSVMEDAYKSFPSGHAAASFFTATYLIMYLHKFLGPRPTELAAAMFDVFLASFAVYISFLRIAEHWHHWWDVVCGAIIGIVIGVYATFFFLFKSYSKLTLSEQPASINAEDRTAEDSAVDAVGLRSQSTTSAGTTLET